MTELEKRRAELEVTGLSVRAPVLSVVWPGPRPPGVVDSRVISGPVGRRVRLMGVMDALRLADTQRGQTMEFVTLEDEYGLFDVTLFPSVYRRFSYVCRGGGLGPYLVEGRVDDQNGARTVTASRVGLMPSSIPGVHANRATLQAPGGPAYEVRRSPSNRTCG